MLTVVLTVDYSEFKIYRISLELFEGQEQDSELHFQFSMEGITNCRTS